jgi:hypothetical protein
MKKLDLSKSIYSSSRYNGLTVKNGRLINNRPDGMTGIAQAAISKRSIKRSEKVGMIAEGVALGNIGSDFM